MTDYHLRARFSWSALVLSGLLLLTFGMISSRAGTSDWGDSEALKGPGALGNALVYVRLLQSPDVTRIGVVIDREGSPGMPATAVRIIVRDKDGNLIKSRPEITTGPLTETFKLDYSQAFALFFVAASDYDRVHSVHLTTPFGECNFVRSKKMSTED